MWNWGISNDDSNEIQEEVDDGSVEENLDNCGLLTLKEDDKESSIQRRRRSVRRSKRQVDDLPDNNEMPRNSNLDSMMNNNLQQLLQQFQNNNVRNSKEIVDATVSTRVVRKQRVRHRGMGNQNAGIANQPRGMINQNDEIANQHRGMPNQNNGIANQQRGMINENDEIATRQRGMHSQNNGLANIHRGMINQRLHNIGSSDPSDPELIRDKVNEMNEILQREGMSPEAKAQELRKLQQNIRQTASMIRRGGGSVRVTTKVFTSKEAAKRINRQRFMGESESDRDTNQFLPQQTDLDSDGFTLFSDSIPSTFSSSFTTPTPPAEDSQLINQNNFNLNQNNFNLHALFSKEFIPSPPTTVSTLKQTQPPIHVKVKPEFKKMKSEAITQRPMPKPTVEAEVEHDHMSDINMEALFAELTRHETPATDDVRNTVTHTNSTFQFGPLTTNENILSITDLSGNTTKVVHVEKSNSTERYSTTDMVIDLEKQGTSMTQTKEIVIPITNPLGVTVPTIEFANEREEDIGATGETRFNAAATSLHIDTDVLPSEEEPPSDDLNENLLKPRISLDIKSNPVENFKTQVETVIPSEKSNTENDDVSLKVNIRKDKAVESVFDESTKQPNSKHLEEGGFGLRLSDDHFVKGNDGLPFEEDSTINENGHIGITHMPPLDELTESSLIVNQITPSSKQLVGEVSTHSDITVHSVQNVNSPQLSNVENKVKSTKKVANNEMDDEDDNDDDEDDVIDNDDEDDGHDGTNIEHSGKSKTSSGLNSKYNETTTIKIDNGKTFTTDSQHVIQKPHSDDESTEVHVAHDSDEIDDDNYNSTESTSPRVTVNVTLSSKSVSDESMSDELESSTEIFENATSTSKESKTEMGTTSSEEKTTLDEISSAKTDSNKTNYYTTTESELSSSFEYDDELLDSESDETKQGNTTISTQDAIKTGKNVTSFEPSSSFDTEDNTYFENTTQIVIDIESAPSESNEASEETTVGESTFQPETTHSTTNSDEDKEENLLQSTQPVTTPSSVELSENTQIVTTKEDETSLNDDNVITTSPHSKSTEARVHKHSDDSEESEVVRAEEGDDKMEETDESRKGITEDSVSIPMDVQPKDVNTHDKSNYIDQTSDVVTDDNESTTASMFGNENDDDNENVVTPATVSAYSSKETTDVTNNTTKAISNVSSEDDNTYESATAADNRDYAIKPTEQEEEDISAIAEEHSELITTAKFENKLKEEERQTLPTTERNDDISTEDTVQTSPLAVLENGDSSAIDLPPPVMPTLPTEFDTGDSGESTLATEGTLPTSTDADSIVSNTVPMDGNGDSSSNESSDSSESDDKNTNVQSTPPIILTSDESKEDISTKSVEHSSEEDGIVSKEISSKNVQKNTLASTTVETGSSSTSSEEKDTLVPTTLQTGSSSEEKDMLVSTKLQTGSSSEEKETLVSTNLQPGSSSSSSEEKDVEDKDKLLTADIKKTLKRKHQQQESALSSSKEESKEEKEEESIVSNQPSGLTTESNGDSSNEIQFDNKFIDEVSAELENHSTNTKLESASNEAEDNSVEMTIPATSSVKENIDDSEISSEEIESNDVQDNLFTTSTTEKSIESEDSSHVKNETSNFENSDEILEDWSAEKLNDSTMYWRDFPEKPHAKIVERDSGEDDFEYTDDRDSLQSEAAVQDEVRQHEEQGLGAMNDPGDMEYEDDDPIADLFEPSDSEGDGKDPGRMTSTPQKAVMKLDNCGLQRPSACFSYPLTAEKGGE